MTTTEVRCPTGPKRLFMKLRASGEKLKYVEGNLLEFACTDCRKLYLRQGVPAALVLHRYNILGELIETALLDTRGTEILLEDG